MKAALFLRQILPVLLLSLAAAPAWSQPERPSAPPDERHVVDVGSSSRSFYMHFPAGSRAAPWPLVLLLHPAGSNAKQAMKLQRWTEASDENGFILVGLEARAPRAWLPAAFSFNPRVWNSGDPSVHDENILASDDVAYAKAVLDQLMRHYTLDTARIYAAGFSSGGSMTQRLALELPGRFAAIAAVGSLRPPGAPLRSSLSVLLIYGKLDPVTPYEGGTRRTQWGDTPGMPPVSDTVSAWVRDLHCVPQAQTQQPSASVQRDSWSSCDDGAEVQEVTLADQGHHWAGSLPDGLKESAAGPVSRSFDDTAAAWAFFAAHPRHARGTSN